MRRYYTNLMEKHPHSDWHGFPSDLADRCVKCAQCLPHCPTWRLDHDEAESPRGRIALMLALAAGAEPDSSITAHLDQCLGCRHCEAVCPADVPYGQLADAAQFALGPARTEPPLLVKLLRLLVSMPRLFHFVVVPLVRLCSYLPILRHPALAVNSPAAPPSGTYAPIGGSRGEVWLFTGCIARATDGETLQSALNALRQAGYSVRVPSGSPCCGALHLHAGDVDVASAMSQCNADAFSGDAPIVTCASGCAATLMEDPRFGHRVTDISTLLTKTETPRPVGSGVLVHTPCTLSSTQGQETGPLQLLPGARSLGGRGKCCGAAGDYLLRHPRIANSLRDEVLDEAGEAEVICTSNPGCAMHIRAGITARGWQTKVHHPVVEWSRHESS